MISGLAFVVITHQAPGHASLLADLLGRVTKMSVAEVGKVTAIEPNHVYTSPPGRNLEIRQGALHVLPAEQHRSVRLPVDYFFRSLALDRRNLAIGIVLSGTGTDGRLGVKDIKAGLGMVMVQSRDSAEYEGMPESSIATGLVDYVLPASKMSEQLLNYVQQLEAGSAAGPITPQPSPACRSA